MAKRTVVRTTDDRKATIVGGRIGTGNIARSAPGASPSDGASTRPRSWEAAWRWDGVDSVKVVRLRSFPDASRPREGRDAGVWLHIVLGEVAIPPSRPGLYLHASSQRQRERQDPDGS